jgi:hypothetical protein
MSESAETPNIAAEAFSAEAGVTPSVVDAAEATVTSTPLSTNETRPTTGSKVYTEDDLSKVRAQEKDKLYPQIDSLKAEVAELKKAREAEAEALRAEQEAKEAEMRSKLEADMDVRDLLKQKEAEFAEQLERERQARELAFAERDREREWAELQSHRQLRLESEREAIIPELLDLVSGNTPSEVDASIESLKERSARILESAQAAMQATRKDMTGTRATLPPTGPMDINSEQRNFTAQEIASMPMNEYANYRQRLLSDKAQGRSQGLFGN